MIATKIARSFVLGVFLKTLGYLTIASGIFLAIGKPGIAINFVYLGAILVAIGWLIAIKSLISARGNGRREEKFKVSLSANGGIFGLGKDVELRGNIGKIVDGKLRETEGKHTAEIRFVEGKVGRKIRFEIVDSKTRLKTALAFFFLFSILFSLLFFCAIIAL